MHQSKKHILVKGQKKLQRSCFEWIHKDGFVIYVNSTSQKLLAQIAVELGGQDLSRMPKEHGTLHIGVFSRGQQRSVKALYRRLCGD